MVRVTTLAEDKQQATVNRILAGARQVLVNQGPDGTMDDVATAAGLSRRTVFRHFPSRDSLLAAALRSGMRRFNERLPSYEGGEWTAWLTELCGVIHEKNDSFGQGYFELITRRDLPSELAAVEARRKEGMMATMSQLASTLWTAADGVGPPPVPVTAAVASHLSVHFTVAVTNEAGGDWRLAADLAATAICAIVRASLDATAGTKAVRRRPTR